VNLTKEIRDIIEQGPPGNLVANSDRLFHEKIDTHLRPFARQVLDLDYALQHALADTTTTTKQLAVLLHGGF
jgi:hypothetical protein